MPRLPYRPEDFPTIMGPAFSSPTEIVFSWEELCWAAVTVGRRNWSDVLKFGTYSILEVLWRLALVRANLLEGTDGRLRQSEAFIALEKSEKGAVSFFLGLVFTKLLAGKLFLVPWLLHLDTYKQQLAPQFSMPLRPDFVGMDRSQEWIVLESKGRTRSIPAGLLTTGKTQTKSVRRIAGRQPIVRAAVGTYFGNGGLRAQLRDPDRPRKRSRDLDLSPETHARAYYRPIIEVIETSSPLASGGGPADAAGYVRAPLTGMDATLQIDDRVLQWYRSGMTLEQLLHEIGPEESVLRDIAALRSGRENVVQGKVPYEATIRRWELESRARLTAMRRVGYDGVGVELGRSWQQEFMRREPEDRAR